MNTKRFLFLLGLLVLALGLMVNACGGDDDDDDSGSSADDDTDDDADDDSDDDMDDDMDDDTDDDMDDDMDDDADDDSGDDGITIILTDVLSGLPISGATCELVEDDGSSFDPAVTSTSDAEGTCAFEQKIPDSVEFFSAKVTKTGYVDTYMWKYPSLTGWVFKLTTPAARLALMLGVSETLDDTKGLVSGSVNWGNGIAFQPVGCATVEDGEGSNVYYFSEAGVPTTDRSSTNPVNGYFVAVNVPAAQADFTFTADTAVETKTITSVVADALNYVNLIYYDDDYASNPQPDPCT